MAWGCSGKMTDKMFKILIGSIWTLSVLVILMDVIAMGIMGELASEM